MTSKCEDDCECICMSFKFTISQFLRSSCQTLTMPYEVMAARNSTDEKKKKTSGMFYSNSYLPKHRNPSPQEYNYSYQLVQGKGTLGVCVCIYLGGGDMS